MARKFMTIKVRLPKKLRAAMKRKLKRESYASASDYVGDLIRKDLRAELTGPIETVVHPNGATPQSGLWRELHFGTSTDARASHPAEEDRR